MDAEMHQNDYLRILNIKWLDYEIILFQLQEHNHFSWVNKKHNYNFVK